MPISPLDVIIITDKEIKPPGPKMVVCICPKYGMFYRINSYPDYPIAVLIQQLPNHTFLKWDSFIECSKSPIELDDAIINSAIERTKGPIGKIAQRHAAEILGAVQLQSTIAPEIKAQVKSALGL